MIRKIRKFAIFTILVSLSPSFAAEDYGWSKLRLTGFTSGIRVTGRVTPQEGALNIESARVQGRILNILAREGDRIAVGTPILVINSAECLSLAEEKRVAEKRKIPDLLEGVQKRAKQLGLNIQNDRCEIVSSYNGSVTKRNVESGATFNPGEILLTVLDTKRLSVEFDLSERDLARVQTGQKVNFKLASEPQRVYETRVKAVVPAIDAASRTARVRLLPTPLSAAANLDGLVFGEVRTGSDDQVFSVPSQALIFSQGARYIVKGPAANPAAVEVEVIGESNHLASIRPREPGQLKEGEDVATSRAIFLFKKLESGIKPL